MKIIGPDEIWFQLKSFAGPRGEPGQGVPEGGRPGQGSNPAEASPPDEEIRLIPPDSVIGGQVSAGGKTAENESVRIQVEFFCMGCQIFHGQCDLADAFRIGSRAAGIAQYEAGTALCEIGKGNGFGFSVIGKVIRAARTDQDGRMFAAADLFGGIRHVAGKTGTVAG